MWFFGRILSSLNQVVVFDTTLHDVRFLNQQWLSYDVALCLQQAGRGQCLADRNTSSDRCTLRSCYFVLPFFHLNILRILLSLVNLGILPPYIQLSTMLSKKLMPNQNNLRSAAGPKRAQTRTLRFSAISNLSSLFGPCKVAQRVEL